AGISNARRLAIVSGPWVVSLSNFFASRFRMKVILSFLLGCAVGAAALWYVNSRRLLVVPSGTELVEVNHFTGEARAVHVWQADAMGVSHRDDDRMAELDKERERVNPQ